MKSSRRALKNIKIQEWEALVDKEGGEFVKGLSLESREEIYLRITAHYLDALQRGDITFETCVRTLINVLVKTMKKDTESKLSIFFVTLLMACYPKEVRPRTRKSGRGRRAAPRSIRSAAIQHIEKLEQQGKKIVLESFTAAALPLAAYGLPVTVESVKSWWAEYRRKQKTSVKKRQGRRPVKSTFLPKSN